MNLAEGLVIADRFRLVRPLGQGGMGAVWLAQHTGLDVPCAVKFIHDEAAKSPELRARFEREAKAAAQLRSPHVVQILDHGVWEGSPYIAMELLEGEDLARRIQRKRPLSPRETLTIAAQIGRALTKAHAVGLVHRDLKPANIFLVRDEDQEIAKVLDFGVAKVKEAGLDGATQTGAVLGTPFYMSPEQARGSKSIDHRSDLWALAVVVYQCLVGKLPFRGDALGDLFMKIMADPLPVPSQVAQVPPGFDAWWARAAARDPADRFQTAKEFTDALGLALGLTVPGSVDGSTTSPRVSAPALPAAPAGPGGTLALPTPVPEVVDLDAPTRAMPHATPIATPAASVATAPTPLQQAVSVQVPPRSGRFGVTALVVAAAVVAGCVITFLAVRSPGPPANTHPAATAPSALAAPTVAATTAPVVTTLPASAPAESSAPAASSAPAPSTAPASPSTAKHAPAAGPTAKPTATPGPRQKTDFGF